MEQSSLQAWAELEASVNGRTLFGQAGVRDPDNRCEGFEPGEPGHGKCDTDGHYLCGECKEMSRAEHLRRSDLCVECEGPVTAFGFCQVCEDREMELRAAQDRESDRRRSVQGATNGA